MKKHIWVGRRSVLVPSSARLGPSEPLKSRLMFGVRSKGSVNDAYAFNLFIMATCLEMYISVMLIVRRLF